MKIHEELVVLDGAAPMLSWGMDPTGNVTDASGKGFDYYIEGGVTVAAATVSTTRLNLEITQKAVGFFDKIIEKRGFLKIRSAADVQRAKREKKFGTWYHMQASYAVEDNLDALEGLKKAGVGQLQPTYNLQNRFANGCLERFNSGLSKAGLDLVKKCNEQKIILDGSHQGDRDILDMVEFSGSTVIVSHANARAVYKLCGANMYPPFVRKGPCPTMSDYIGHIDYLVSLVGIGHVAIGPDYMEGQSGITPDEVVMAQYKQMIASGAWDPESYPPPPYVYPEGVELPTTLYNLTDGLLNRGYSKEDIGKIWGGNWMRVLKAVLG